MRPHIEVELYVLTAHEGGRNHPIHSGYRPSFRYRNVYNDVVVQFTDQPSLSGGERSVVFLTFHAPELQSKRLFPGLEFDLTEGDRRVAMGSITAVLDDSMSGSPPPQVLPFHREQHAISKRSAIFEDDGKSGCLYLTAPNDLRPTSDVWVYNRIPAPNPSDVHNFRPGPPPAPIGHANDNAMCSNPQSSSWSFLWSRDGESVSLLIDEQPLAFIIASSQRGYSRNLLARGPWGSPWNSDVFDATFDTWLV